MRKTQNIFPLHRDQIVLWTSVLESCKALIFFANLSVSRLNLRLESHNNHWGQSHSQLWSKCWKVIVDGEAREETWHDSSALQPVTRVMMMTVKGVNRAGLCSTGLVTRAGDLCCHDQPNTVISSAQLYLGQSVEKWAAAQLTCHSSDSTSQELETILSEISCISRVLMLVVRGELSVVTSDQSVTRCDDWSEGVQVLLRQVSNQTSGSIQTFSVAQHQLIRNNSVS